MKYSGLVSSVSELCCGKVGVLSYTPDGSCGGGREGERSRRGDGAH